MVLYSDLSHRKRVLRRVQFINKEDLVEMKGKVGCEISAGDEILLTDLLFSGFFNEMQPNEIAALLSSFVHDENAP